MTNSVKKLIVSNRRYSEIQVHTSLKHILKHLCFIEQTATEHKRLQLICKVSDLFVLPYMSDVEIQNKTLEFTFSMISSAKYQPVVFPEISYIISHISQFNCIYVSNWLTEFCTHISRFTVVRPL